MKKFFAYTGVAVVSVTALILIGVVVVSLFAVRLETSNERLAEREEERSALEDRWIELHKGEREGTAMRIEDVTLDGRTGTIAWEETDDTTTGTAHFKLEADGSITYLENISEFPQNYPSYKKYFRDAIQSELN
ncbi:MAG: hypothetical protein U5K84_05240 [Alkalibacterium sp.]|nr:hypothetical protein [Alkalibacterium sp.]